MLFLLWVGIISSLGATFLGQQEVVWFSCPVAILD